MFAVAELILEGLSLIGFGSILSAEVKKTKALEVQQQKNSDNPSEGGGFFSNVKELAKYGLITAILIIIARIINLKKGK